MAESNIFIGKQIGNYRIDSEIASGGFGGVYLAQHIFLTARFVAIKMLHAIHLGSQEEREGFLQEAQWLEKLKHPYILPIYDVGIHEGIPYLIAEYAQNGSLRDRLRRAGLQPLPVNEALTILSQVGQALQHAHQQNVIHRDLKPENILFNARGDALLADFGISTVLTTSSIKQTQVSGTPSYMAPEQFRGIVSRESDQYSLGCIAYELFTGQRPFGAADFIAMGFKHTTENPPPPSEVNPQLPGQIGQVILKAMAKERSARYTDITAFITALKEAVNSPNTLDQTQTAYSKLQSYDPIESAPTSRPLSIESAPTSRPLSMGSANPLTPPPAVPPIPVSTPQNSRLASSITPPAQVEGFETLLPQDSSVLHTPEPLSQPPSQQPSPPIATPTAPKPPGRPKRLLIALLALCIVVLIGSVAFFVFSPRTQTPTPPTATVGHGFFTSSGAALGQNNQGINDTFQLNLSTIPNPSSGKSYYAWLLPDSIQSEAGSISLGPLDVNNGSTSLHSSYVDPQHTNLIALYSRLLITEESTNPPPQSYSLDKKTWRYYAEIPQTPASRDCTSHINQLSDLCHIRHLLSGDPELNRVNLSGGLSFWFVNNAEEVQKWAREAVDHSNATDVRHKIVNILYMLEGPTCIQQTLQQASSAPGTDNRPDDSTLNRIAAVPLLDCALTPAAPGYLIHIHNHLGAIIQSSGVLADQVTLATQISAELNTMKAWLGQVQADARRLVSMNNTQLTQANGLALRHEMDTLTANVLSGGTDPNTGSAVPGIVRISAQLQQLASFDVKQFTA